MIYKHIVRTISNEEKSRYPLESCILCNFYGHCELVSDYLSNQVQKSESPLPTVNLNRSTEHLPLYMQEGWERGVCVMKDTSAKVNGVDQWVADGIGDDFKADVGFNYKEGRFEIVESRQKWDSCRFVFISAQTGNGKNHFIENVLLPYVRWLNHEHETELRVLILSNRIALRTQTEDRLKTGVIDNDKTLYRYKQYADVMSYQSILNQAEYLKHKQGQKNSSYIFVICDEAHFFTSDAAFNAHTEKILETIVYTFADAVRVYMTATPYECLKYINGKESKLEKYTPPLMYHFQRDYSYLNEKYFSDENTELRDIIINSVVHDKEKWLIFIDHKNQGTAFKNQLENNNGETTPLMGKVMTISTESKDKDEKYQRMILTERFDKDINVVIATSVIDNGVNFRDIDNVVITDLNRIKCLQMVGRIRIDKNSGSKVTLYIKRHGENFVAKRLRDIRIQQDAYHDYDMAAKDNNSKWDFHETYYNGDLEYWENAKHWFGMDKKDTDKLYINGIARSLADKQEGIYESILQEMKTTDKGKEVIGQKYLEYQLSWFGKTYNKKNDITLNGYKNDSQLSFEKWIQDEWLDKQIPKTAQKDFGKKFFEQYNPKFGLCTKKQGFSSDDNRGENGPKFSGYGVKRINEIFQIRKMPFELIENDDFYVIVHI